MDILWLIYTYQTAIVALYLLVFAELPEIGEALNDRLEVRSVPDTHFDYQQNSLHTRENEQVQDEYLGLRVSKIVDNEDES